MACLLALCLVVGLLPLAAFAEANPAKVNFNFNTYYGALSSKREVSTGSTGGTITTFGNLILDNVDVSITLSEFTNKSNAISAIGDNNDASCNNAGCTFTRTIETPKPGTNGSAQTGDVSVFVAAGLALASAVSFGGVTVLRKKK